MLHGILKKGAEVQVLQPASMLMDREPLTSTISTGMKTLLVHRESISTSLVVHEKMSVSDSLQGSNDYSIRITHSR